MNANHHYTVFVYAEICKGDKIMLNHSGMRYDKNRLAKYQHHISLYSSTEMGRIKNDISAKIFPSLMEDVIRCVSFFDFDMTIRPQGGP
jgi:hypothetical protein